MHQEKAQEELGIGLDGAHGGAAALLPTAGHLRPGRGAKGGAGASPSSCGGCAREVKVGRGAERGSPRERSSPASSTVLRRAIPKDGMLTTTKQREHGVRGVTTEL